jgi:hypothetical protein
LIQLASKFTTSTLMVVDRQRIGIKTSDLHEKKVRTKCMTQENIISKIEEAIQTRVEAEADFKKSLCTTCFTRKILIIGEGVVLSSSN